MDLNMYPKAMSTISNIANIHQKITEAAIEFGIINRGIIADENDCIKVCEYENAERSSKCILQRGIQKDPI